MKKIKLKTPAKINLTLDVVGVKEKFHEIKSLVASIDLYDYFTIKKRKDNAVNLITKGINPRCDIVDNNAYKSAKLFINAFKTNGVDIIVDKRIPVGAGLGGSSVDIAGVLKGMKELYGIKESVIPLADSLGSDSSYMLKGGWAVLKGRGDEQEFVDIRSPLYLIALIEDKGVSSKKCYKKFDESKIKPTECTDKALNALKNGKFEEFCALAKNDLFLPSSSFVEKIAFNINSLKQAGAPLAIMTGSGTATLGVFNDKKSRDKVYKKLKPLYGGKILKAKTI